MDIAIVGSSGYIARSILDRLEKEKGIDRVIKIDRTGDIDVFLDLQDAERFDYRILDPIDQIIFTAAVSGPDQCASDFERCWAVNVTGTIYFVKRAIERRCRVLFFSSDAVFGDIPGEIYTEGSKTRAETPYGRMKKEVEDTFKGDPFFKAIRLSYVISARDRFVSYCLRCLEDGEVADIFHPFYRNCICVSDVVDVVAWFIGHWDKYKPFVLNVAGKELVSRVRIADEINRIMRGQLKYKISMPGEDFYKNRPRITQMKSLYMEGYRILKDGPFTEKIQRELSALR